MNENNKKYFSTGEFAKLCKVHKKTLFHYDDIDLFKPEKVNENGYRYYSEHQVESFNVISTLKNLGMPLKDIKDFMDKRNPQRTIQLFEHETKEIDKEIENLKRIKEIIYNKIKVIKESENITNEIIIEYQEEEYLVLSKPIDTAKSPYDMETYMNHLNYCYNNNLNIGYPVGTMNNKENLESGNFSNYTYFYTKVNKDLSNENIIIKPAGTYLVGYFKGYYDKVHAIYKKMLSYISENNLNIIGYSYEDVLIDEVAVKNPQEYIIKVSIQIANR